MKDAFGNELEAGDFVVYAVGQGRSAGGLRIGRVTPNTSPNSPVFTAFHVIKHSEFDDPDEIGYDRDGNVDPKGYYADKPADEQRPWMNRVSRKTHIVVDGWREDSARRIGGFNQVKKILSTDEIADPELKKFMDNLK